MRLYIWIFLYICNKKHKDMKIFRKPDAEQGVKDERKQQGKVVESKGESDGETITVFKGERRKGNIQNKGKDRNASSHR